MYARNIFNNWLTPDAMVSVAKTHLAGITNACRIADAPRNLLFSMGDKSLYATGKYADSTLFSMFTLPFVLGSITSAFSYLRSILTTQAAGKKFFGDKKNVIGKNVPYGYSPMACLFYRSRD